MTIPDLGFIVRFRAKGQHLRLSLAMPALQQRSLVALIGGAYGAAVIGEEGYSWMKAIGCFPEESSLAKIWRYLLS